MRQASGVQRRGSAMRTATSPNHPEQVREDPPGRPAGSGWGLLSVRAMATVPVPYPGPVRGESVNILPKVLCGLIKTQIFTKGGAKNDSVLNMRTGKKRNMLDMPHSGYSVKTSPFLEDTPLRLNTVWREGAPRRRRFSCHWDYGKSPYAAFFLTRRYDFRNPPRRVNVTTSPSSSCGHGFIIAPPRPECGLSWL